MAKTALLEQMEWIIEHDKLDKDIKKLEKKRGFLPYESVVKLRKLKKRKLLLKDLIAGNG